MNADLFLKNVPSVVKDLIGRQAHENRRSVNQEAIALLEEALLHRVETHGQRQRSARELLRGYADSQKGELESSPAPKPVDPH